MDIGVNMPFNPRLAMKKPINKRMSAFLHRFSLPLAMLTALAFTGMAARASVAYGSINNFDTVNDTSNVCHGFEIELDDIHTTDITYTFDYNHYGTPKIFEDTFSVPGHTNVIVRYEAVWTNTGWSAYTAIPTNNIPPTQGHAFTNPSLNFGGEHFGVGYRNAPSKVYYFWLTNSGSSLLRGPQVSVSTPIFNAPAPAQVVPVIPAPVLPLPPPPLSDPTIVYEFSDATWVKVIATTSHTNKPVALRDLITPDTNNPNAKDWRNGEPDQVETEWQLLQTDYKSSSGYNPTNGVGGSNGQLAGKTNNLAHSDDVVTYRYEYYAYVGPYADLDTHEALAQNVATDGTNGTGSYANTVVVGKFLGAQMSAMSAAPPVGLINHLPDGEVNVLYPTRAVVIASDTNFTATCTGLPAGMTFDAAKGWIGNTPSESGVFIVRVNVSTSNGPVLTKNYPFMVGTGAATPPHSSVDTGVLPFNSGTTSGDGVYDDGTMATVTATPHPGYGFLNWTDNGIVVSTSASYMFTNTMNRSLVANFGPALFHWPGQPHTLVMAWLTNFSGCILQQNSDLRTTNWTSVTNTIYTVGTNYQSTVATTNGIRFFRLVKP